MEGYKKIDERLIYLSGWRINDNVVIEVIRN